MVDGHKRNREKGEAKLKFEVSAFIHTNYLVHFMTISSLIQLMLRTLCNAKGVINCCHSLFIHTKVESILLCFIYIAPHLHSASFIQHLIYVVPHLYSTSFTQCLIYIVPHLYSASFIQYLIYIVPHLYSSSFIYLLACAPSASPAEESRLQVFVEGEWKVSKQDNVLLQREAIQTLKLQRFIVEMLAKLTTSSSYAVQ